MENTELLRSLREMAPWHFDVELPDGTRTSAGNHKNYANKNSAFISVIDPAELEPTLTQLYPSGLAGKSFLDVACNGGGYSILAKRLGAEYAFGFDSREHWITQCRFLADQFGLQGVDFVQSSLDDVTLDRSFDICLFKGIFYHLPDPIAGLKKVADMTREVIIVDSATSGVRGDLCLRLNKEGKSSLMTGMDGFAWWPSGPDIIAAILNWLGFPETREIFWRPMRIMKGVEQPGRCRILGARSAAILKAFDVAGRRSLSLSPFKEATCELGRAAITRAKHLRR